jgi:acyl-CoA synthetase (NDP forming)
MVTAHSGALAGEHGAYEAVFDAYGVHEVRSLDEMADTIELFSAPRRTHGGRGIASIHDSGGERALFVDLAAELEVPIASVSGATLERIGSVLDPGLEAANPLDAWGRGSTPTGSSGSRSWLSTTMTGWRRWPSSST